MAMSYYFYAVFNNFYSIHPLHIIHIMIAHGKQLRARTKEPRHNSCLRKAVSYQNNRPETKSPEGDLSEKSVDRETCSLRLPRPYFVDQMLL
jgi:hypothetical protein